MVSAEVTFDLHRDGGVGPLDLGSAFLRARGAAVAGRYALAVAPLLAAAWLWIDAVSAEDRTGLGLASLAVAGAMLWRWAGLAWVQAGVMREIGYRIRVTPGRVAQIVLARLLAHGVIVWGSLLLVPGVLGFFFSAYVSVMVLEDDEAGTSAPRSAGPIRQTLRLTIDHWATLLRRGALLGVLGLVAWLSVLLVLAMLIGLLLPSLLGIDTVDLQLAGGGVASWLSLTFLTWVLFDFYVAVVAVFEVDQLRARRRGGDLLARLRQLAGETT
jgi:hypothetical protein